METPAPRYNLPNRQERCRCGNLICCLFRKCQRSPQYSPELPCLLGHFICCLNGVCLCDLQKSKDTSRYLPSNTALTPSHKVATQFNTGRIATRILSGRRLDIMFSKTAMEDNLVGTSCKLQDANTAPKITCQNPHITTIDGSHGNLYNSK